MGALPEVLRAVASGLFAQQGVPWFLGGLVVALGLLLVRAYLDRKRLSFEEVYNSKIGFHRPFDRDAENYEPILQNFNNVSILVLRVWNSGRSKITPEDFRRPLELLAHDRFIVDFRVSDVLPPGIAPAEEVENNWRVCARDRGLDADRSTTLGQSDLRASLPDSIFSEDEGGLRTRDRQARRKLTIPPITLGRRHSLKLVVCLREDGDLAEDQRTRKAYEFGGELQPGKVIEKGRRQLARLLTIWVASVLGAVSAVLLVGAVLQPDPPFYCADGSVSVVGSSAFAPTARYAADRYAADCGGARFDLSMTSSLEGTRALQDADRPTVAFTDGSADRAEGLTPQPIAVLTYAVIVNDSVGTRDLTRAQLRDIYAGRVTNWSRLGGPNLPIRIVGRNADSGSRQAFERYVLGSGEGSVTSNSCTGPDRGFVAPVVRCERQTTTQVLREVDQVPGALGYVDASAIASYPGIRPVTLDGVQGSSQFLAAGYAFWTIEYAYTRAGNGTSETARNYLDYLRGDLAARRMREEGYIPCVKSDGLLEPLCQGPGR